ncbi:MAG TPA: hypothetical protein VHQ90_13400 [Thermoanaerobaculia bacterium]|nr:hypothetical protein [Thermoanaerobaculia bacterium]
MAGFAAAEFFPVCVFDDCETQVQEPLVLKLVAQNGAPIPLPTLVSWAMGNGERPSSEDRLVVPLVEAGQYEVCRIAFSHLPAYLRGNRPAERCAAGALAIGGKLTLRVPGR